MKNIINPSNFTEIQQKCYAYLLGLYLGDGYINVVSRTTRLRIALHSDEIYIQNQAKIAIYELFLKNAFLVKCGNNKCVNVTVYSNNIIPLFPQDGKGPKHLRKIAFTEWQEQLVQNYPEFFITGLYDADGTGYYSRYVKKNKMYNYLKYSFGNSSIDIMNLFVKYVQISTINSIIIDKSKKLATHYKFHIQNRKCVKEFQNLINGVYTFFNSQLDLRPLT